MKRLQTMGKEIITSGSILEVAIEDLIESGFASPMGVCVDTPIETECKLLVNFVNDLLSSAISELILLGYKANIDMLSTNEPLSIDELVEDALVKALSIQVDVYLRTFCCEIENIRVLYPSFDVLLEFKD